jgi:hypothetical protein
VEEMAVDAGQTRPMSKASLGSYIEREALKLPRQAAA